MRDPAKSYPALRTGAQEMLKLSEQVQEQGFSASGDFAFVAFLFFGKQVEHMRAVLVLADAHLHRDAGLIARSMLEGLAQLLWAAHKPEEGARQWRKFSVVSDWRKMRKRLDAGESIGAEEQSEINGRLASYGADFLTERGQERLKSGRVLRSRDYWENWTGRTYSDLFDDVKGEKLRYLTYSPLSAWQHWDPGGFGETIASDHISGRTTYVEPGARPVAEALAVSFQCLFQTLEVLDQHVGLRITESLTKLKEDYQGALDAAESTSRQPGQTVATGDRVNEPMSQ